MKFTLISHKGEPRPEVEAFSHNEAVKLFVLEQIEKEKTCSVILVVQAEGEELGDAMAYNSSLILDELGIQYSDPRKLEP